MNKYLELYESSSNEIQEIIQILGGYSFTHLKKNNRMNDNDLIELFSKDDNLADIYNDKLDKLQISNDEAIENIEEKHKSELRNHIEMNDLKEKEYQKQINTIKDETKGSMVKEIDDLKKINNLKLEKMQMEVNQLEDQIKEYKEKERLTEIIEDKFVDKVKFKNPTEQGNYAENMLNDIVDSHELPFDDKAKIENTADTGGSGDRIISFSNGFRLMIEVKNKDTIKPTDINQFEEHYIKDFNENKSDVALFLSYRTPNITGKHACNAITSRYFNDDKVVYFGLNDNTSKVEKREKIKEELHSIYRRYVENKETNSINNCDIYNDQLMLLKENRDYLTKLISQNKNDLDMNNKKLSVIEKKWNDIHQYILVNNINVDHCLLDNKLFKKIFLTRICNWMKENSIKFEEKEKKWRDRLISGMKLNEYEITKLKQNKYISLKDIIVGTTST
tara:strand:- start:273 stop:1616 length:1344 start_codon:yes stop_codon:yes gene_type:complete